MRYFSLLILFLTTTLMASNQKLTPVSHYKLRNNVKYNDIWVYTDSKGREYALLGVRNGTSIIQVLDDGSLKPISFIELSSKLVRTVTPTRRVFFCALFTALCAALSISLPPLAWILIIQTFWLIQEFIAW